MEHGDGMATWYCQSCDENATQLFTSDIEVRVDAYRHAKLYHPNRVEIRDIDDPRANTKPDLDATYAGLWRAGLVDENGLAAMFGVSTLAVHRRLVRLGLIEPTIPKMAKVA